MPFIWNDKTYWKRYKVNAKIQVRIVLPAFIVSFLLWRLFLDDSISLISIIFVSFLSAGTFYTFLGIFLLFTNPAIPDTYSKVGKRVMFIIMFLVSSIVLYNFIVHKVLG
jgi:uncharacterized membrane protein YfcA